MFKILRYLRDYKKESVLGPLFKLLEASFELIIPMIMASIIDKGIASGDKNYILKMCMIMVMMGVIGLFCAITAQYFAAKAAVGFATQLRKGVFEHIQTLSYTELDDIGESTLITRITSDINQVQTGVNLVIRLFLRSPFIVFGAMIMAFRINVSAAVVFAITIPLLSIVVFGIMIICIPFFKKVQSSLDKVLLGVRENISGVRVIRAINFEEDERKLFKEKNKIVTHMQLFVGKISALLNPITYIIINLAIVILVNKGAILVNSGIITTGAVVALVNYMSQILVELVKLANLIITVTKSIACGNRIQEVFEIKPSMPGGKKEGINIEVNNIKFENVSFKYKNAKEDSISNISFNINKGETIGIIGGTGSGKSTIINLIPRFYDITSGNIFINGKSIKDYDLMDIRKSIIVVPQKSVLFKGTIRENIRLGNKDASDDEIINALKIAKAYDFVMDKDKKLDYVIEQGGKNLSGGQRQRLAIARSVVTKASVIIFDDSMSALDFATDYELRKELEKLVYRTKIIVSQRIASLGSADRIIVLDDGKMVGMGSHDELKNTCKIYREIYNSQIKTD